MTFQALESTLPNGFHDALLYSYEVDYVAQTARLHLALSTGDPHATTPGARDTYRRGILHLHGLDYFVTDAPDSTYPSKAPQTIDSCDPLPDYPLAKNTTSFRARLYSSTANSFIHFAATDAEIIFYP